MNKDEAVKILSDWMGEHDVVLKSHAYDSMLAILRRTAQGGEAVAWAVTAKRGGIHKLAITRESAEHKQARWLEEWPDNKCAVRPLVFADAHPAPVAPVPDACIPEHWMGKAEHITSGKMSKEESGAQAVMLLKILLKAKPTPATGSIGDDAEFCDRITDLVCATEELSHTRPKAWADLVAYIEARTPAGNTSQGAVTEGGTLLIENGVSTWVRGALGILPDGIYSFDLNTTPVATPVAAPPPPAAVAPEWAEYLREGETPLQRLQREIKDSDSLATLLAAERAKNAAVAPEQVELQKELDIANAAIKAHQRVHEQHKAEIARLKAAPPQDTSVRDARAYKLQPDEKIFYSEIAQTMGGLPFMTDSSPHSTWNVAAVFRVGERFPRHIFTETEGYQSPPAQSVALSDADVLQIYVDTFNSMPGGLRTMSIPTGQGATTIVAFARAIIARISDKGAM